MIPPVARRLQMDGYLEDIATHLTMTIMEWKKAGPYKRQAYEILIKNGFNNQEFFDITQEACDYCDYLIYHKYEKPDRCIPIGCEKLLELHIALMIKSTGQLNAELPGVQNYYKSRIQEYPELMRNVREYLLNYGNNLGEEKMNNGQPFYDNAGNYVQYNQFGQLVYAQPPLTAEQQHALTMQRRTNSQFQQAAPQQYPVQQNNWGVNPAPGYVQQQQAPMANSMQQQLPNQYVAPLPPGNNAYSGYNNNPNAVNPNNGSGLGPITPHNPPSNRQHPGASSTQRHTDLPAPAPQGSAPPVAPAPMPGFAPKAIPEAPAEPAKPVNPLLQLVDTHSGYECTYSYGQENLTGLLALYPILFDVNLQKGIFELDSNKKITNFKLVGYKENEMDYKTHETAQFFNITRAGADTPDKRETRAMLANIQRKLFVEEKLAEVEHDKLEGNVVANEELDDLSNPLIITKTLQSAFGETDFINCLFQAQPDDKSLARVKNRVVNFDHMCWNGVDYSGAAGEVVSQIRTVKTWLGLNDILNSLVDVGQPLQHWHSLNTIITDYVNDVLLYQLNIGFTIDSFNVDIDELIKYLLEAHDIRSEFTATLQGLIATSLFPVNGFNEDYHNYITLPELGEDDEAHDAENLIIFTTLTDVTVLPIESSSLYLPIPQDKALVIKPDITTVIVTWESYPELFNAIHDRMENKHSRTSHVVFVTADGVNMYIKKTATKNAYILVVK